MKNLENLDPEDVWLRFFLRRLRLGLRSAKSPNTVAVLKELIADAEERLDCLERGTIAATQQSDLSAPGC